MTAQDDPAEAARVIEELTGASPALKRKKTRKEKQEERERVRRFLALSPELQEGVLKYAEHLKKSYNGGLDRRAP
ncbi:MAG: hypothetical protein ACE5LQ_04965 [Candidatus Bipolaricaulia bacterium]